MTEPFKLVSVMDDGFEEATRAWAAKEFGHSFHVGSGYGGSRWIPTLYGKSGIVDGDVTLPEGAKRWQVRLAVMAMRGE